MAPVIRFELMSTVLETVMLPLHQTGYKSIVGDVVPAVTMRLICFAVRVGFEPTDLWQSSVFKTDAIDQLCHLTICLSFQAVNQILQLNGLDAIWERADYSEVMVGVEPTRCIWTWTCRLRPSLKHHSIVANSTWQHDYKQMRFSWPTKQSFYRLSMEYAHWP